MLIKLLMKIFPVKIGDEYVLRDSDLGSTFIVTIVEVKGKWIRYKYSCGGDNALGYLSFLFIYRKKD